MADFVYLIRNGDLYNIGLTEDLDLLKKRLAPGILEAALETNDAKTILAILRKKYSAQCLPQSSYYRLTKTESRECIKQLEKGGNKDDFMPFFSGIKLLLTFISVWVGLSILIIKLAVQPVLNQFN